MCVCLSVCVCVCVCVCMYYVCVCVYVCVCMYVYVCVCVFVYVFICVYVCRKYTEERREEGDDVSLAKFTYIRLLIDHPPMGDGRNLQYIKNFVVAKPLVHIKLDALPLGFSAFGSSSAPAYL